MVACIRKGNFSVFEFIFSFSTFKKLEIFFIIEITTSSSWLLGFGGEYFLLISLRVEFRSDEVGY